MQAVAGWLGSYGGEDSTSDISRGLWAGTIGTQRLLKLFDKYNIKATWFIVKPLDAAISERAYPDAHSLVILSTPFLKTARQSVTQVMKSVSMATPTKTQ